MVCFHFFSSLASQCFIVPTRSLQVLRRRIARPFKESSSLQRLQFVGRECLPDGATWQNFAEGHTEGNCVDLN